MGRLYNVDTHIPPFAKDVNEKTFYREFLTITEPPRQNVASIHSDKIRWFLEYLRTADIVEAYWRACDTDIKNKEAVERKLPNILRQSGTWAVWKFLLYSTMKRFKAGLYIKILDATLILDDIHPKFQTWIMKDNQFADPGINRRFEYFNKGLDFVKNPTRYPSNMAKPLKEGKPVKSTKITLEEVPVKDVLPDNLKKMPIIGGLDKDVSEMDIEQYRRHLTNVHVGNLHIIALNDEEKASDRVKASEIILRHVGAFEIDNKQKSSVEFPEETVKLLEYLKEKQNRLHQFVRQITPYDKEVVVVDVEKEKIITRQTQLTTSKRSRGRSSDEKQKLAAKILEEQRYDKSAQLIVDNDTTYDKIINHKSKKRQAQNIADKIIDEDGDLLNGIDVK